MSDGTQAAKVPVIQVAREAFRAVFGHFGVVLDVAWLPLLLLLAAAIIPPLVINRFFAASPSWVSDFVPDIIYGIVAICGCSAFAVRWYRLLLVDRSIPTPASPFLQAWRKYLLYSVILSVAAFLPFEALAIVAQEKHAATLSNADAVVLLALSALMLAMGLCNARLSLIFPAASLIHPLGWRRAWQLMGGNTWRYIGACLLATGPFFLFMMFLPAYILQSAGIMIDTDRTLPLGAILLEGLSIVLMAIVGSALTVAVCAGFYRRLASPSPERPAILTVFTADTGRFPAEA